MNEKDELEAERRKAIEECARLVEQEFNYPMGAGDAIARALRALRDKL